MSHLQLSHLVLSKDACGLDSSLLCGPTLQSVLRLQSSAVEQNRQHISDWFHGTSKGQEACPALALSLLCIHKVVPRLHSEASLRCCHHALLAVVHTPQAVKLSKVHIGLNAAVLSGWK